MINYFRKIIRERKKHGGSSFSPVHISNLWSDLGILGVLGDSKPNLILLHGPQVLLLAPPVVDTVLSAL
jgi:hypothetical protein